MVSRWPTDGQQLANRWPTEWSMTGGYNPEQMFNRLSAARSTCPFLLPTTQRQRLWSDRRPCLLLHLTMARKKPSRSFPPPPWLLWLRDAGHASKYDRGRAAIVARGAAGWARGLSVAAISSQPPRRR